MPCSASGERGSRRIGHTHERHIDSDPIAPHSLSPRELKALLRAESEGRPLLVLRDGGSGELRMHPLDEAGPSLTIGRRAAVHVSLPWDAQVSGLHAQIECSAGEWLIVDDGLSMNGTFVNGERVPGRQRLRDGDRVRVGRTTIAFIDSARAATQPTAAASEAQAPYVNEAQRRVLVALCRPYADGDRFATPPSNQQIADEVFLSVDTVKMHLRALFASFDLADLPRNEKRARLAAEALRHGLISRRDFI